MNTAVFNFDHARVEVSGFPERQAETIARTAIGHSSKQTAKAMGISPRTVEMNLNLAMAKLGACNRPDLISLAWERGQLAVRRFCLVLSLGFALILAASPSTNSAPDDLNRIPARNLRVRRGRKDELALIDDVSLTTLTEDDEA